MSKMSKNSMSKIRRANVSLRPSELVIAAIHNLEERKGSTSEDIVDFISNKYSLSSEQLKGQVEQALKRGVYFGVLSENNGLYQLLHMGPRHTARKPSQKRKKVTIKLPPGKNKRGTKVKRKPCTSLAPKRRTPAKTKADLSKKCCMMKIVRRKKQKLGKALQAKKAQLRRKKAKPRHT